MVNFGKSTRMRITYTIIASMQPRPLTHPHRKLHRLFSNSGTFTRPYLHLELASKWRSVSSLEEQVSEPHEMAGKPPPDIVRGQAFDVGPRYSGLTYIGEGAYGMVW